MRALLWKEVHENAYKVATGLGVVLLVHALRQLDHFNRNFAADADGWAMAIGGLCAGVLAMDVVAGERSRGTLEFLLVRPTTIGRILLAKFLVGAMGLLLVIGAFWAMVYATPIAPVSLWQGDVPQLLHDVSWPAMVYAWYLPMLVLYATVFATSAATDNPAEAAGAGAVVALVALMFFMLAHFLFPEIEHRFTAPADLLNLPFSTDGRLLQVATHAGPILRRTLLAGSLIGLALVTSTLMLTRYRQFSLSRRSLVVSAFVLVTLLMTLPRLMPDRNKPIHPIATVTVGTPATAMALDGDRAYVLKGDSLLVLDITTGLQPSILYSVEHTPEWSLHQLRLVHGIACALGRRRATGEGNLSIRCFDCRGSGAPEPSGSLAIDADGDIRERFQAGPDGTPQIGQYLQLQRSGDVLLVGAVGATRSALTAVSVDPAGQPHITDTMTLETYDYPAQIWQDEFFYTRDNFLGKHAISVETEPGFAYLGWHGGLRVIAVSPAGGLTQVGAMDTGDEVEHMRFGGRQVQLHKDTLWLGRTWPKETIEIDVSTPSAPRLVAVHEANIRQAGPRAEGFYYRSYRGVPLFDVDDPWPRVVPTLTLPRKGGRWGTTAVELRDGRAYALMDDQFAVFTLPVRD